MSRKGNAIVGAVFLALVVAILATAIWIKRRREPESDGATVPGTARPAAAAAGSLSSHCDDFVSFVFGCGIGRPPADPTVDVATQRNNELVIQQALSEQCRAGRPPYDKGLLGCFLAASGDCQRYSRCADAVVDARHNSERPVPR